MKNFFAFSVKLVLVLFLSAALFVACKDKPAPHALDKDTSYAFGMFLAGQLTGGFGLVGLSFDYDAFKDGFRDFNEARETRFTMDQVFELITAALMQLQAQEDERMWIDGGKIREEGEAFLAENATRSGVITTPSGLQYEVITQGSGRRPRSDDMVRVHYEGTLIDGIVFDSSYRRGEPVEFPLNQVIPGWTEGVQLMNEGSTFRFFIPHDLAYGSRDIPGIPPYSTLIFEVELISILRQ